MGPREVETSICLGFRVCGLGFRLLEECSAHPGTRSTRRDRAE